MKKHFLILLVLTFQFSAFSAEEKAESSIEIAACNLVDDGTTKSYESLNDCLMAKFWRNFKNPQDNALIYFWTKSKNNQNVRVQMNWKPIADGRLASLFEAYLLGTESSREAWAKFFHRKNKDKLYYMGFKKSALGKATLLVEDGFSFKDLFHDENNMTSEVFAHKNKIETSISVLGMKNKRLQYRAEFTIDGGSQVEEMIQFEITTDWNPMRSSRIPSFKLVGRDAQDLDEVLP